MRINRHLKGFSIVELAIAMSVMALLLSSITPSVIKSIQMKAAEKTAREMLIIQESAKSFYQINHRWPQTVIELQSSGFLDSKWALRNPWGADYRVILDEKIYSVITQVPVDWTGLVARNLPAASIDGEMITSSINASSDVSLMQGIIVAWSGLIADIPVGWVLCDGANGTPDLRDKFIIGSSQDDQGESKTTVLGGLEKKGGSTSHDHGGKTGDHVLTINEMPRHHHGYMATPWTGGRYDGHSSPLMTQQVQGQTDDEGGDQPHHHSIAISNHLPPFYALAFIMKIS